jgi:hypothetical protein
VATASCFGFGLLGFLLLPTAPPWLVQSDAVTRVTERILPLSFTGIPAGNGSNEGTSSALAFETNHIAAMPSMHVAIAVLIALAMARISQRHALIGFGYATLMSFSVVYLGEHFLLDVIGGWLAAVAAWWLAEVWLSRPSSSTRYDPPASRKSISNTRGTRYDAAPCRKIWYVANDNIFPLCGRSNGIFEHSSYVIGNQTSRENVHREEGGRPEQLKGPV